LRRQILDFAARESRSIISVTRDEKEDGWIKCQEEIICPRLEVRYEFQRRVKEGYFWMYRTRQFIETAKKIEVYIAPGTIKKNNALAHADREDEQTDENDEQPI